MRNSDAVDYIPNLKPFRNSTGSFVGQTYPIGFGRLSEKWRARLSDTHMTFGIEYIVYSYATPIAWYADGQWEMPYAKYSATTSRHQSIVMQAI